MGCGLRNRLIINVLQYLKSCICNGHFFTILDRRFLISESIDNQYNRYSEIRNPKSEIPNNF
jgi:hypothetical protein